MRLLVFHFLNFVRCFEPMSILNVFQDPYMTIETKALECLLQAVIDSGHRIVNQSRDEADLDSNQKRAILQKQLSEKPHIFLEKYHPVLKFSHLQYFKQIDNLTSNDEHREVISFYISKIRDNDCTVNEPSSSKVRANRRYQAMKKLSSESDFFDCSKMRLRDPEAYHSMIGQYLNNDQLNSVINEPINDRHSEKFRFEHLLQTLDEQFPERQASTQIVSTYSDEEFDTSDDEMDFESEGNQGNNQCAIGSIGENTESADKLRNREFLLHMQQKFLQGLEKDVDYESIDSNPGNDWSEERARDEEQAWFDDE